MKFTEAQSTEPFSDKIGERSLLPFAVGIFCIIAKRLNPVGPESSRQIPAFGVEGATLVVK